MTKAQQDFLNNPDDPRHGTDNGYTNLECRCVHCTAAHNEVAAQGRAERAKREPPVSSHGKPSCYQNWKCRRPECVAAHSAEIARQRAAKKKQTA